MRRLQQDHNAYRCRLAVQIAMDQRVINSQQGCQVYGIKKDCEVYNRSCTKWLKQWSACCTR